MKSSTSTAFLGIATALGAFLTIFFDFPEKISEGLKNHPLAASRTLVGTLVALTIVGIVLRKKGVRFRRKVDDDLAHKFLVQARNIADSTCCASSDLVVEKSTITLVVEADYGLRRVQEEVLCSRSRTVFGVLRGFSGDAALRNFGEFTINTSGAAWLPRGQDRRDFRYFLVFTPPLEQGDKRTVSVDATWPNGLIDLKKKGHSEYFYRNVSGYLIKELEMIVKVSEKLTGVSVFDGPDPVKPVENGGDHGFQVWRISREEVRAGQLVTIDIKKGEDNPNV